MSQIKYILLTIISGSLLLAFLYLNSSLYEVFPLSMRVKQSSFGYNQTPSSEPEKIQSHPTKKDIFAIQACWMHLFTNIFIKYKLNHNITIQMSNENTVSYCSNINIISDIASPWFDALLSDTFEILSNITILDATDTKEIFSFHDLLRLRRCIMLIYESLPETTATGIGNILALLSRKERQYMFVQRCKYPIFNIHLPRSAGSTICYWYTLASGYQHALMKSQHVAQNRIIYPNPEQNCNVGDGDPFYGHLQRSHAPKTCNEQYKMAKNFTVIARESPLYNNNDKEVFHPFLCDKFVYTLSVRSPIERILSWLQWDVPVNVYNESLSEFSRKTLKPGEYNQIIRNFFSALYDYDKNKPWNVSINVDSKYVKVGSVWIRGYASNALTRWIGYEFTKRDILNNELMKGLLSHRDIINKNDIHFMNAINMLLQIDYVLNFGTYRSDFAFWNAVKFDKEWKVDYEIMNWTQIEKAGKSKNIWNLLANAMNAHFATSVFNWQGTHKDMTNALFDLMTEDDWKTLYEHNYFDFRLYYLAKWIAKVDIKYYNEYKIIHMK